MPSTEVSIWLALRARIASLTLSPTLPIAWPNEPFTPPATGGIPQPYLAVDYLPNVTASPFLADDSTDMHRGILQISVCHRLALGTPQGETAPREVAGQVAAHFPRGLNLFSGGVKVKLYKRPDIGAGVKDNDRQRYVLPVSISYEAFA